MMKIRQARPEDMDAIVSLEQATFSRPWSRQSLQYELDSPDSWFAAAVDENGSLWGFAIMHAVGDEGEIFNIAVAGEKRRQGIGSALMGSVMEKAALMGVEHIYLEVRRSNEGAQALYRKYGFCVGGIRKNYYDDPREDAVLMDAEVPAGV